MAIRPCTGLLRWAFFYDDNERLCRSLTACDAPNRANPPAMQAQPNKQYAIRDTRYGNCHSPPPCAIIPAMSDEKPPRKSLFGDKPFGSNPPRRRSPDENSQSPPDPSLPVPDAHTPGAQRDEVEQSSAEAAAGPVAPDNDPADLSLAELIRDISDDEPPPTPKLAGEDEAFGDGEAAHAVLSFDELEAKVARREPAPRDEDTPTILKPVRKPKASRRAPIRAKSYVEDSRSVPRLNGWAMLRSGGVLVGIAALVATLMTWWTPGSFLPVESQGQLAIALATQGPPASGRQPTPDPSVTIGIVSGHRGINPSSGQPDPGALCADGLTEASVNYNIAAQVATALQSEGYVVDVLDEFDPRLANYRALAMVSIHADSCEYVNDSATGFKVASFAASQLPDLDSRLVTCLIDRYGAATGLSLHQSVTFDMTEYHNFREIDPATPGAIIEVGFLYLDRDLLTNRSGDAARGIVDGLNCFLRHELPAGGPVTQPTLPIDTPTETPTRIP